MTSINTTNNKNLQELEVPSNVTTIPLVDRTIQNEKNIPAMIFIENVDEMCIKYTPEKLVEELQVFYNKYKYMEAQTLQHSESIKAKIPDIEKAIDSVTFLQNKRKTQEEESLSIDFMVAHNLWAKADVPVTDTVCLWLGADILCEYPHDEALALLNKNLNNAKKTMKKNEEVIDMIRDNITISEVNIARAYNVSVKNKEKEKKQK